MKTNASLVMAAFFLVSIVPIKGQGTFQNLDFEAAQIVFVDSFQADIVASNALPGWSAVAATSQLSVIPFGLLGAFYPVQLLAQTNGGSISGNFSLLLSWLNNRPDGSISQTGIIPADARSLLFKSGIQPPLVSLGGQSLLIMALSTGPNYTLYGADISGFSGQTSSLVFAAGLTSIVGIDDIQFSSQPVPEPAALALIVLSSGILLRRRLAHNRALSS